MRSLSEKVQRHQSSSLTHRNPVLVSDWPFRKSGWQFTDPALTRKRTRPLRSDVSYLVTTQRGLSPACLWPLVKLISQSSSHVTVSRDTLMRVRYTILDWVIAECEVFFCVCTCSSLEVRACLTARYDSSAETPYCEKQTLAPFATRLSVPLDRTNGQSWTRWLECRGLGTQPFNEDLWCGLIKSLTERLWQVLKLTCINDVVVVVGVFWEDVWPCGISSQGGWRLRTGQRLKKESEEKKHWNVLNLKSF